MIKKFKRLIKAPSRAKHRIRRWMHERTLFHSLEEATGLDWQWGPKAPMPLFDSGCAKVGRNLYVLGGYLDVHLVSDTIEVLDLESGDWVESIPTPDGFTNTHMAVTADDRHLYMATGQLGPQCSPAVRTVFSYDTIERRWRTLPEVTEQRYAPTMQLWRGRLHLIGGAGSNRWDPKNDHWSLAVKDGQSSEDSWRTEKPIPVCGMHRGSIVHDDRLFVFGGQQGDFMAIEGDPNFCCTGETPESYLSDSFRLDEPTGEWQRIADLPIATSHTDYSVVEHRGQILVIGGQIHKNPETFFLHLTDAIQAYDPVGDAWSIAGYLPYRLKLPVCAMDGDRLTVTGGQRAQGFGSRPWVISNEVLQAHLPEDFAAPVEVAKTGYFSGKRVLLLTHDLTRSGAPLTHVELAQALTQAGALVRMASLEGGIGDARNIADECRVPLVPGEVATELATQADLTILSTAHAHTVDWLKQSLAVHASLGERVAWWIHEIHVDQYADAHALMGSVGLKIFDSQASLDAWQGIGPMPGEHAVIAPALPDAFLHELEHGRHDFPCGRTWYGGTNYRAMNRDEARSEMGVGPSDLLVTCIGSFQARKGQKMLIRTLGKLNGSDGLPIKAMLVGFNSARQMHKYLGGLSPDEKMVLPSSRAFTVQPKLEAFYQATDLFVMNSQGIGKEGENFGRVTAEAMAAGAVVLGTDAGGTPEIIEDGVTGFLYPPGEEGQMNLAERISELASDESLRHRLSEQGMKRAREAFSMEGMLERLEAACEDAFG